MVLKQKKSPLYKNFEIINEGVRVDVKTHEGSSTQTIKFEEIGFDEQIIDHKPSQIKTGLIFSVMLNVILGILYVGDKFMDINAPMSPFAIMIIPISILIIGKTFFKIERLKYIVGQKNLSFWYDLKRKTEVDNFISQIKLAKNEFIRNKYLKIEDHEDSMNVKHRLVWLKNDGYISEDEFKEWSSNLDNRTIIKGF